ncbi:MAG: RNA polymerase sigma factor [Saprospiraceae bacterium]|nr:RNA polymerase sigma factor [Lewinella sp.]
MTSKQVQAISESELIGACREGREYAYRELISRYEERITRTILGMLGPTPAALDTAQETFIRFFQSLDQYRGTAKVSTYLLRIAINLSLNELKRRERKQQKQVDIATDDAWLQVEDATADPGKFETRQLVRQALYLLPPEFRAVVVLRLMDGYSVKEVAAILDLPEGTVCSRLMRGQKKLRAIIEQIS